MDSLAIVGLHAVVFVAAVFQTATGIGFALIAGPFLLIAMQDGSAIQISIMLNLLMSAVLAPTLVRHVHWPSLKVLSLGAVGGLPFGIVLFLWADLIALKLGAATIIALALLPFLRSPTFDQHQSRPWHGAVSGLVAGIMTAFAAMPGPAASFYLSGLQNLPRDVVRSTIYAFFVLTYGAALVLHSALYGVAGHTITFGIGLLPAVAAGMLAGIPLARRMAQNQFRIAVAATLLVTATTLVLSTVGNGIG